MSTAAPEPKANMGEPAPRVDGRLKVTGQARYPADVPLANAAYAFLVTSPIARGRITALDLEAAKAVPGVLDILTHENTAGQIKPAVFQGAGGGICTSIQPLGSDRVQHDGQIVAVVVADTYEAAREAAYKVRATYAEEPPSATFDSPGLELQPATAARKGFEDAHVGDAEAALASAEVVLDAEYGTPTQHHNPMELFTTSCAWQGQQLTVYEPSQFVYGLKNGVAQQLGIDPADVRAVSTYVGGAFGSKGTPTPRTALIALAAKRLNRPVKLVATRSQGFTIATYRAETRHRIRLGASRDGRLTAYSHEAWEVSSRPDGYFVGGTKATSRLYAAPNVWTRVSVVHADRNTPGYMRSPPEVPYVFALETAMDELAVKLGMDPIELRRVNDPAKDPITGVPFSSRSLVRCYDEAAAAFGWKDRDPRPGSMRDGDWLVGWGCATAVYPAQIAPATARVRLTYGGEVRVETAAHEIGNGAQTVIGQMAARELGVPLAKVQVMLGDSALPPAPVAGGSNTTASVCNVVMKACGAIRDRLARAAVAASDGPLAGRDPASLRLADGRLTAPDGASEDLAAAIARLGAGAVEEYAENVPHGAPPDGVAQLYQGKSRITGGEGKEFDGFSYGAELLEVRVNARTREIRVPRIVGAFAAGHIMNPRTARSQYLGGLVWGVGSALHEATEIDRRAARYVNDNLAEYLIPVNADIQQVDIILVPEQDDRVNPAGIKGVGELANVGTAAAVANAVYHATGKRLQTLPIRIDDLV